MQGEDYYSDKLERAETTHDCSDTNDSTAVSPSDERCEHDNVTIDNYTIVADDDITLMKMKQSDQIIKIYALSADV